MEAVELKMPDGRGSGVWMCGKCRILHTPAHSPISTGERKWTDEERDAYAQKQAERCCNYRCLDCGEAARRYHDYCDSCGGKRSHERDVANEAERFKKARHLTVTEWSGEGMLFDNRIGKWFTGLDEAEEWYADDEERERPAYLWCSEPVNWQPDFSGRLLDSLSDNYHEDARDSISEAAIKELDEFEKKWWGENEPTSYEPDFTRCVILPEATNP